MTEVVHKAGEFLDTFDKPVPVRGQVCASCGKRPPAEGYVMCVPCRIKAGLPVSAEAMAEANRVATEEKRIAIATVQRLRREAHERFATKQKAQQAPKEEEPMQETVDHRKTKLSCQYCGREIAGAGPLGRHEKSCSKNPANGEASNASGLETPSEQSKQTGESLESVTGGGVVMSEQQREPEPTLTSADLEFVDARPVEHSEQPRPLTAEEMEALPYDGEERELQEYADEKRPTVYDVHEFEGEGPLLARPGVIAFADKMEERIWTPMGVTATDFIERAHKNLHRGWDAYRNGDYAKAQECYADAANLMYLSFTPAPLAPDEYPPFPGHHEGVDAAKRVLPYVVSGSSGAVLEQLRGLKKATERTQHQSDTIGILAKRCDELEDKVAHPLRTLFSVHETPYELTGGHVERENAIVLWASDRAHAEGRMRRFAEKLRAFMRRFGFEGLTVEVEPGDPR